MRRPTARPVAFALVAAVALAVGGCSDKPDGAGAPEAPEDDGDDTSSPFVVAPGAVPDGYRAVVAGPGALVQEWGSDSFGTTEPYTVLGPPGGDATDEGIVIVATTGFEGYQGGLAQASNGYLGGDVEEFDYEGRPAIYTPPAEGDEADDPAYGARGGWADLVAVRGDDVAVRVTAPDADRDALVDMLDRVVVPEDHAEAPEVVRPPAGLEVLGSVDADLVLSASPYVYAAEGQVAAAESAHAVGWVAEPAAGATATTALPGDRPPSLAVATVPGDAGDLAALGAPGGLDGYGDVAVSEVAGGVVVDRAAEGDPRALRTFLTEAPWGDLVVVGADGPADELPSADELAAVAAATSEATTAEFEAQAAPG